jgi:rubrerythrin
MFESIAEVDTKYSKIIDKECESVSADIRKWFKKLAKEEKSHDDRLANANEKIRQAGTLQRC